MFFSDSRVQFADMSGDGLMDLVWIHGSRIDYWPGLGNGQFAPRRQLTISPNIAAGFEISRLFLADINGDGVSDVVYVKHNQVQVWINQSGNALAYVGVVEHTPLTDGTSLRIADMEGRGVAGLLWSYSPGQVAGGNYKYLAFSGDHKPYLMSRIDNGMGLSTHIHYQSSAQQAQQALTENRAWDSHLPFPLQTVSRIEEIDEVSGAHTERSIRYRNGLFDGRRRQFLGFEQVAVFERGDANTPSSETISWFYQGRNGLSTGATVQELATLAGRLFRVEVWDRGRVGISTYKPRLMRQEQNDYQVKQLALSAHNKPILFAHLSRTQVDNLEGQASGATVQTHFQYDNAGNITRREEQWDDGAGMQQRVGEFRYSAELSTNVIKNLPLEYREYDTAGQLLRLRRYYYDGPAFAGLPLGQVVEGNLSRVEQLVFTQSLFNNIYSGLGLNAKDMGYHGVSLPDGTQGWATNTLRQRHNSQGNPIARQDAFGHVGTIGYDPQGIAPVAIIDPMGLHYQGSYHYRAARLSQVTDPNGQSTQYQFDPLGRLNAVIKPGDSSNYPTQIMNYQSALLPVSILIQSRPEAGVAATVDSIEYVDGKGQVFQRRSQAEDGQVLVDGWRAYNHRGWESKRSTPFFSVGMHYIPNEGMDVAQQSCFQYDALGRIVATLTPDGHQSKTEFAPLQVTRFDVTDMDNSVENVARGHFDTPRVESIDAKGNLIAVTEMNADRSTVRTQYQRDPMGQLISVMDPRGLQVVDYHYDLLGRKIQVAHMDAGTRRRLFDARGDLAHHYDGLNRPVSMVYDAARRKTEVRVEGLVEESYHYDTGTGTHLLGRLSQVSDAGGTVDFSYTARGLLTTKARHMTTLGGSETFIEQFAYDALERVTQVTRPDGSQMQYHYNERGVAQIPEIINGMQRNALGQLTQLSLANGVTEHYNFDADSFYLDNMSINPSGGGALFNVSYQYDAAGNPLTIKDHISTAGHVTYNRQFNYDALSRLTAMTGDHAGTAVSVGYTYDAAGNFTHNDSLANEDLFLEVGSANRLAGVKAMGGDTTLFTYDANGAMVSSPNRTCEFDARGRLVRTSMASGVVVNYRYAYDGARVRKQITQPGQPNQENLYISEYFERLEGANVRFVVVEGRRVAAQTLLAGPAAVTTHYLHGDHLGNIVLVTDQLGNKVREVGYRPFGGVLFSAGGDDISHRGFIGCERDDHTGLVYCAARYYDPGIGRFISPDPYLLYAPEKSLILPANLNLYVYAANNPMRQVDNQGTFWKWLVGALIIVALVVATVIVGVATGGAGFAFGILLAASIGSALGAGMGVASAAMAGGTADDMANGFLFGAIVGGAAGAAGYAAGAAVGDGGNGGEKPRAVHDGRQGQIDRSGLAGEVTVEPRTFHGVDRRDRAIADRTDVQQALGDASSCVVDALPEASY
ncbi:MAG: toxin TcdB middle/N-terminal domain-containing protein, partial [Exilibacterium sp.]